MKIEFTAQQQRDRAAFRSFVDEEVVPYADQYDQEERLPSELVKMLAHKGYLGAVLPAEVGGTGLDFLTFGLLNEELGRGCSSLRSLLTVHSMVARCLLRWGNAGQRERWLSTLATGESIAAFALTEPGVGSDAGSVETSARLDGEAYVLNGKKSWITCGQIADLFLVFAQCETGPAAFLLEKETPGLLVKPVFGMLGVKASMLAELHLDECRIPRANMVGKAGFGISHLASSALDYGRYSVAWGCVGIAQACLEACLKYTSERQQFGSYLRDHQLIQRLITRMVTDVKAARLLCCRAGYLKDTGDPDSVLETSIAKYFASQAAMRAADDAVQIHGANGCSSDYPVQRYLRDAKIMEIIEGSTQIQEITIARNSYREFAV